MQSTDEWIVIHVDVFLVSLSLFDVSFVCFFVLHLKSFYTDVNEFEMRLGAIDMPLSKRSACECTITRIWSYDVGDDRVNVIEKAERREYQGPILLMR